MSKEITEAERRDHIESIAADHVRKGFYDENDLKILGITREDAEAAGRARNAWHLAGYIESLAPEHQVEFIRSLLVQLNWVRCLLCGGIIPRPDDAAHAREHQEHDDLDASLVLFEEISV